MNRSLNNSFWTVEKLLNHFYLFGFIDTCNGDEMYCLSLASQDRLALDAIKALHRQLDDDADGNVDLSESDEVTLFITYLKPI